MKGNNEASKEDDEVSDLQKALQECRRIESLYLTTALDITELKHSEDALSALNAALDARVKERTRQVRELASQLTLAEQEERRRISEILHDDLQQQLYAVNVQLGILRGDVAAGRTEDVLDVLGKVQAWLEDGIGMTRTLAVQLWPPMLANEDLAAPLNWLVAQVKERYGLTVDFQAHSPLRSVDAATRVLLYRIVRELLFNIVRHAATNVATIELREVDQHVEIRVADEGHGFNIDAALSGSGRAEGFGLHTVRQRLLMLGGRMEITSAPEAGTVVTIIAPLRT